MNTHDFYNLLDDKIELSSLKNGIWTYPPDFLKSYNAQADIINGLRNEVRSAIEAMTVLEKEQFKYTAGSRAPREST